MPTPDDLTPDAFARLTALEQSQELLRRAQFLSDTTQRRQVQAIDRHQDALGAHGATVARLEDMLLRQQDLQAQVMVLHARMVDRQDALAAHQQDHAARMAQLQLIFEALLHMVRDRHGH